MARLTVEIPDAMMSNLIPTGQPLEDIVLTALEQYIDTEKDFSITQTKTWQLCGSLEVSDRETQYMAGQDEAGKIITTYAEHIDDVVYYAVPY
ncbi:hypothetical protein K9N68_22370 [Kovacikia minuta CCNUW1]|uniref:hypothetical protein n=1 Tax=Kovacikia minuta TaxID=2931930 RepID=UPI001CCC753D|nr:hypothetical protein [Kovacikia minuta]UBF24426.1 hypothetical protein K9N68_22370 [Kovacikia minuta CCNUW1]